MKGLEYVVVGGALVTLLIVIIFERDGNINEEGMYYVLIKLNRLIINDFYFEEIICHHVLNNKYPDIHTRHFVALDRSDIWRLSDKEIKMLCGVRGDIHRSAFRKKRAVLNNVVREKSLVGVVLYGAEKEKGLPFHQY